MYHVLTTTVATAILAGVPLAASATTTRPVTPELAYLVQHCAPGVEPSTMRDVILTESRGHRFAINVNGNYRLPRQPRNEKEAAKTVRWLSHQGYNFDVGYAQVNSTNFESLGVSGPALFNGCTNIRAGATVLSQCYTRAVAQVGEGQAALKKALSCYNTGSLTAGFANGYVAKVVSTAQKARTLQVPALQPSASSTASAAAAPTQPKPAREPAQTAPSEGEQGAFGHPDPGAFVTMDSDTNEKVSRGEEKKSRVPYSAKAVDAGAQKEANHQDHRAIPRGEAVDSDVPSDRPNG